MDRRDFATLRTGTAAAAALTAGCTPAEGDAVSGLQPMLDGVTPISDAERATRLERARQLMTEGGIDAIVVEPGTTLSYFTDVQWGLSERPFAAVIPARGEPAWICPGFEEERARERVAANAEVRVWQEDESPYGLLAGILRDRGMATGRIGIEQRLRYFIADGLRREAPRADYVLADPVTTGCRMIKSPAEIALMQRANDITMAAFRVSFESLTEGMTSRDLEEIQTAALLALGGTSPWVLVGFGESSAFPHGSVQPQALREGEMVLMDSGCAVEGYQADVTRTTVFGTPTARQREVWDLERRAQDAAFAAVEVGAPCGSVDDAARAVITEAGFGPDYRVPGLPHRTGHGIGMDGHEWPNFVRGETQLIQPGMCFSDEPMIAIYGEFGIRLEDCLYVTEDGPRFFGPQSSAIDLPLD
jgi:Xaa-Pro dipeptidase